MACHGAATTQNMPCSGSWSQITRPGTLHVLGRRTYDDPEHGMFWVVEPKETSDDPEHGMFWVVARLTTQNMACSGSWSQGRRPTTQNMACSGSWSPITRPGTSHVLGRRTYDDPEHDMFWVVQVQTSGAWPPRSADNRCMADSNRDGWVTQGDVRRPRTCHVLGRPGINHATRNMACSGSPHL